MGTLVGRTKGGKSHARIPLGGCDRAVSEQFLNNTNIGTVGDHVSRTTVSKGMSVETSCVDSTGFRPSEQNLIDAMSTQGISPLIEKQSRL